MKGEFESSIGEFLSFASFADRCSFLRGGGMDIRVWSLGPSKGFSCCSLFHLLSSSSIPHSAPLFASIWKVKVPKKIKFFRW